MPSPKTLIAFTLATGIGSLLTNSHAANLIGWVEHDIDSSLNVDRIVTGRQISPEHLKRWRETKAQFDACKLCGPKQPYPGDEPTVQLLDGTVTGLTEPHSTTANN